MSPDASPPIRIAQIVAASSHSPWFTNICFEMTRRGFEVVAIIDSSDGDLAGRLAAGGIRHYKVPMYFGGKLDRARLPLYVLLFPFVIGRMAWILRRERIDVAHSHVFVANFAARMACLLARTRHVAGIAGPRHLEARITRMAERLTCWADDLIVGGCEYIASIYRRFGVADDRIASVYYGSPAEDFDPASVDRQAFRRELGIPPDAPVVGLVAHFYPPMRGPQAPRNTRGVGLKGHETFLAAARIVAGRFPEARFVLVGSGSNDLGEQYRQSLIDDCRADDNVFFPGHRSDLQRVLVAFDVAVQCSLTECLGGTIEALLMERPTVVTKVGGMPEAVRHEETGLVVPPADAPALAAAIERLLSDRPEAQRLARAGRTLMLERFTLARTGSDLAELYTRVARLPRRL
jgi:glycosyltransferase involved in cell wall biosynthesis